MPSIFSGIFQNIPKKILKPLDPSQKKLKKH